MHRQKKNAHILTETTEQKPVKPPRKRLKRFCLWTFVVSVVICLVVGVGTLALLGKRIAMPDWVRAHVSEKINADLSGLSLGFGELSVLMRDDWVPQLSMQNVVINDDIGTPLIQLSDVQGTADLRELLRGKMRPGKVSVSGVQVLVRRSMDGQINLQLGNTGGAMQQSASPTAFIEQIDELAQRPHFASLTQVTVDNLTLRYEDARAAQAWNVDGGRFDLIRNGDSLELSADLALLGNRAFATTMGMAFSSEIGSRAADLVITFEDMPAQDIAGQSPALSWLRSLDAPISGGLLMEVDEDGNLGPLAANLDIAEGTIQPNEAAQPIAFNHARADLSYNPETALITFNTLEYDGKYLSTQIQGQTRLEGMGDGWPDALTSQFHASRFEANPMEIYEKPIALEEARLDMRLTLDPFTVTLGELSITDQGNPIRAKADIRAEETGWAVSTTAHIPQISPERLLALWPETLEPKTRKWITSNVRYADLQDIQFAMQMEPEGKPQIYLGFDFDNLASRFIKNVPIIEDGRGTAVIQGKQFAISAHSGVVNTEQGPIDITGSSFEIEDIATRGGEGVVRLKTDSSVPAALSLLNAGPFGFIDKAGQTVDVAEGHARLNGTLRFPVVDDLTTDEVEFAMTGVLEDVRSDKLVKDRVLTSKRLNVDATSARLRIGGLGQVGQVPFEGNYTMPLTAGSNGRANVGGWIELSETFMEEFNIGLPPGSVSGVSRGQIDLNFERGTPPKFALTSDLAGLSLALPPLGWRVSEEGTGELAVSGTLGEPPSVENLTLNAAGLRAEGSVTLQPDGQLQQANFSRVQLGSWIDAPVDLVGLGPGQPPLIRVAGGTVDLRQTSLTRNPSNQRSGQGGPVSLRLDRLQISDGISLTDFNAELDMSRGADGRFTGNVNGQAPIAGRISPQNGRSAFAVTSNDAGAVFRSANLLKQARDGRLELYLVPGQGEGVYEGKLEAANLRITDAPTMAALLNAISVVGLIEQLDGEGIHFNQVDATFQLAPERVTLYSGSAVGASMGISMEGYYNTGNKWLDMEGVISPVYALNLGGLLSSRQGEGLVGFGYKVDGVSSQPRVRVDPFSVLTPGVFRDIFRRSPPDRPGQAPPEAQDPALEEPVIGSSPGTDR